MEQTIDPDDKIIGDPSDHEQRKDPEPETPISEAEKMVKKQESESTGLHSINQPQTPGKKIRTYLFEFLMLFLAVFCGFIADNWREKSVRASTRENIYKLNC